MSGLRQCFVLGLVLLVMLGNSAPPLLAQDDGEDQSCPEGLVYDPNNDICSLPEDADTGETDQPEEDGQPNLVTAEPQIGNLTLLTFSCPINWDPATRPIESSRDMCTEQAVPVINYTILFEGTELTTAAFGVGVDLVRDIQPNGTLLPPGMWTIRENPQEGLSDPFAFCAIYAADGTHRLTVRETVPGGSLNILLAAGEEVNCEWYSVAAVPEVTGDPNALPIGGLTLNGFSCPYGTYPLEYLDVLRSACIEKGLESIEYTASLNGTVVSTQAGPTDDPLVDFQRGLDTRLLSGTWTVAANLPATYETSLAYCTITTEAGETTTLERAIFGDPVVLELQPGDVGFCEWFSIEAEPRSGPSLGITLGLRTCPEDFDLFNGDTSTCTLPLPGQVTIDFVRAGQVVESTTVEAPATEVKVGANGGRPDAGEWTIRTTTPADWIRPSFHCQGVDANGTPVTSIDWFPATDGTTGVTARFGPNLQLVCQAQFYAGTLDGAVSVDARICPDDFDPSNLPNDRNAACVPTQAVPFTFAVDDAVVGEALSGRNGLVRTPTQPGQWRITAGEISGSDLVLAFAICDRTFAALNQGQTIEPTINSDRMSITLDLDEGDTLRCAFFLGSPGTSSEAPPVADEVPSNMETEDEDTGDSATGMDTTGDPGTNTETSPAGTSTETGTAGSGNEGTTQTGDTSGQTGSPGTTSQTEAPPMQTTGDSGVATISIQHYACDFPVSSVAVDWLVESCTASLEPSSWTMNGEPVEVGDGYVVWEAAAPDVLTVGNLAASETDDSASAVFCSLLQADGEPLLSFQVPARQGTIELVYDQPAVVYCAWFVAP